MTTLKFNSNDQRDLLDTLIEAVSITEETGERPSVEVGGTVYPGRELTRVARLLPDGELQEHHAVRVAEMFDRRQFGYRRAALKLAHRATQIVAANELRRELLRKI